MTDDHALDDLSSSNPSGGLSYDDEQRLRDAFRSLADALDTDEPGAATVNRLHGPRTVWLAGGALVAAAAVTTAIVLSVSGSAPETDPPNTSAAGETRYEAIACAKQIVVGTVGPVSPGATTGTVDVTIDVDQWLKPDTGPGQVTLDDTPDLAIDGQGRWKTGDTVLVFVPSDPTTPAGQYLGDVSLTIDIVEADLPQAANTTCPSS